MVETTYNFTPVPGPQQKNLIFFSILSVQAMSKIN